MLTLDGRRILLTRSAEDCADWAHALEARGAQAVILPCIEAELIDSPQLRRAVQEAIENCDWLVFTSRRGVVAFAALAGERPLPRRVRIAAVGRTTGEAAERWLGRVELVGGGEGDSGGTAAALAQQLAPRLELEAQPVVVMALAENAGTALEHGLTATGARVTRLDVYRTRPAPPRQPKRALSSLGADNILFASPSAVTGFINQVRMDTPAAVFAIGPSTAARARELGLAVTRQAREPSLKGLLEALQCRS